MQNVVKQTMSNKILLFLPTIFSDANNLRIRPSYFIKWRIIVFCLSSLENFSIRSMLSQFCGFAAEVHLFPTKEARRKEFYVSIYI